MIPLRKYTVLRRVKDITLSTTLGLALLNGTVVLQSCGSGNEQTEQTKTTFGKGVRTFITETAPGTFKITDEVPVDPSRAGAIVSYADGRRDTLSVEAARKLVETDASTSEYLNNPNTYSQHHRSGLSNVLLWGSLGYMLGRRSGPQYANDARRYGSGVYANPNVYNRAGNTARPCAAPALCAPPGHRAGAAVFLAVGAGVFRRSLTAGSVG